MRSALPCLADAVSSIITHSSNHQFRQKCRDTLAKVTSVLVRECSHATLQIGGCLEITERECIAKRLWEIAEKKLHVSKTQTRPPEVGNSMYISGLLLLIM